MTTEFLNVPVWLWIIGFFCLVFIFQANNFLAKRREVSRLREMEEWRDSLQRLEINQVLEIQFLRECCILEHREHVDKLTAKIESTSNPHEAAVLQLSLDAIRDKVNDLYAKVKLKHDLQHNNLRAKHYRVLGHGL